MTIIDSYTNYDSYFGVYDVFPNAMSAYGQSFKTPDDGKRYKLTAVTLYMKKSGAPTGNLRVEIYEHSGVYGTSSLPTGSALAVSEEVSASTLQTSLQPVVFSFTESNSIILEPNTAYCLVVKGVSQTFNWSNSADAAMHSSGSHSGNACVYTGSWLAQQYMDLRFMVEGAAVYELTILSSENGSTDPATGVYAYGENEEVEVEAEPDDGYKLAKWILDGEDADANNPFTVIMNANHTLQAVFAKVYTLTIESAEGGVTYPAAGTYEYEKETSVVVYAIPNRGFKLEKWTLNDVDVNPVLRFTVSVTGEHTLTPDFTTLYSTTDSALYDKLKKAFSFLGQDLTVQLQALTLGEQDSETGLYLKVYSASSIEMIIVPRSEQATLARLGLGVYVAQNALGVTLSYVRPYDKIVTNQQVYVVQKVPPVVLGGTLHFYLADLREVKLQ